jgi:PKD repeat protein
MKIGVGGYFKVQGGDSSHIEYICMRQQKLFFILFGFLFLIFGYSKAQSDQNYRIDNSGADTIFYCNGPVAVAPFISIENLTFENASDGIKISIANYRQGEDMLSYSGNRFTSYWDAHYGNLELKGEGTSDEYEEAVRQVFYKNLANIPDKEPRSFSISLLDADYLPYTEHFYLYIRKRGISWTQAKDSAASMNYYGLKGYLATIISSVENDFIWTKIDGVGWIGASDSETEGTWKWVTGPEAGIIFWQGTSSGTPVNGRYSFWNTGEPNNVLKVWGDDEDYAHINAAPTSVPKSWNDLPNEGDKNTPNGYYFPEGFVVEFGGMPGDPDVKLSASAVVAWGTKPVVDIVGFNKLMCGESSKQLQLQIADGISTILHPIGSGTSVEAASTAEPVIKVPAEEYGTYRFELEIIDKHSCSWFDTIEVKYQHQPVAEFQIDEAKCKGYNLQLFFEGETEGDARFDWYSNDTLYYSGINVESFEIPLGYGIMSRSVGLKINENGCIDSTRLDVTVTPALDFTAEIPEGCSPMDVQLISASTEPVQEYHWDLGDGTTSDEENPTHTYTNNGITGKSFDISLRIVSAEGCENSGTKKDLITVHPIPTIDFDFNEMDCHNDNAEVNYIGSAGENDNFIWDLSDLGPDEIVADPGRTAGPLLFTLITRPTADIGLQVISEFGCKTDTLIKTFKRKPIFLLKPDTIEGCPPLEVEMQLDITDTIDVVDYNWEIGNDITAEGSSVTQTIYEGNSNHDVTIIASSSLTGCRDTLSVPGKILVYPVPEVNFDANPSRALISNPVIRFENLTTGASGYSWDFGDQSSFSDEEQPVHRYDEMGRYDVTLKAINDMGCIDSLMAEVSVSFDQVFPPNAFSPNAVKEEDREFRIHAKGVVDDSYKLLIFNRWG